MPLWPFKRRPKGTASEKPLLQPHEKQQQQDRQRGPVSGSKGIAKSLTDPAGAPSKPSSATTAAVPKTAPRIPPLRNSSYNDSTGRSQRRRVSQPAPASLPSQPWEESEKMQSSANKENVSPRLMSSREDITALPMSYTLEQSPHLRPVDLDRPQIPYNFRPHSISQTSLRDPETESKLRRPQTLHSKRSTTEPGSVARRASSKRSKRRENAVREEEIRALSQPIPIPKRTGDGPLRRESKKVRGTTGRESQVSLPPEGSVHSAMSGILEQRGWEIGGLGAVFTPRPAVRLSGVPQYVVSTSLPQSPSGVLYRIDSIRAKDKQPAKQEPAKKRRTVGDEADELDAGDIRTLMERDAKRREKRHQERQEKLERKLQEREGRNRGDSDARKRRAEQQIQAHGPITPPTETHPALRGVPPEGEIYPVGLGIGRFGRAADPMEVDRMPQRSNDRIDEEEAENPFTDAAETIPAIPTQEQQPTSSTTTLPLESPEEPVVETAQAVQLSRTTTSPITPTYKAEMIARTTSQLTEALRQESVSAQTMSDLRPPPPFPVERRSSDPPQEKRGGTWATFFRRGGTMRSRRREGAASPTEASFSNTSRESMRNQPLPAHLVGTTQHPSALRSQSGTPVRTQSKFREDLPETPVSPPESRTQSPEVPDIDAARIAALATPQTVNAAGRVRDSDRNDTPVSQSVRGHTAMASSLASINSEGEWLAGGSSKRQSHQSGLSRSLSKRNEFNASFEELGGDGDVDYMTRNRTRKISNPALIGASPDEESEEDDVVIAQGTAASLAVHGSVRHKPTLIENDPRMRSREGLVTEYASGERIETPDETPFETPNESPSAMPYDDEDDDDDVTDLDEEEPQITRATSVKYSARHSRQFSAGSAKLLDVTAKRASVERPGEIRTDTPEPSAPSGGQSHQ